MITREMNRADVFDRIKQVGIIPAIRASNATNAVHAAKAICLGGITVIEISMSMPGAKETLEVVVKACGGDMIVGAGTIINGDGVRVANSCRAQFIVTPGFSSDAVDTAAECGLPIFAGALTPTEVQAASASGVDAVKLFPCYAVGGPRYLKSLRTQYPNTELIASGGVGLDNCAEYIRAGACAIGVGGEIADADSLAGGDYRVFTVRAKRFQKAISEAQARWSMSHL
jgi:2-dehydro-3-deoxyphosphogluconate aldolase/(4S)-4-hydroxy-2-oxoglutarate aldolase